MAEQEPESGWSMGLKGWASQLANLTGVALICLMFYQAWGEQLRLAREDRVLFRETIQSLRESSDEQWRAIRTLSVQIKLLAEEMKRGKGAKEDK